jgi:inosine-uridine nucleoside N-ribohydrolase
MLTKPESKTSIANIEIIVETDLGHDPDDFFALCYLHAAGVKIKALLVGPGDPDQIAIAKFFCKEVGLDIPIAAAIPKQKELSSGGIHHALLKRYGQSLYAKSDCTGAEAIQTAGDFEAFFVIGPATCTAQYLTTNPKSGKTLTMQGGFLPYHLYPPTCRLEKFAGKSAMRTFNLLNDADAAKTILTSNLPLKRFIGKNVCHTIEFNSDQFAKFSPPKNRAEELFAEGTSFYFEKHKIKKFHDPTAAVCLLHPEIGTWVRGNPLLTAQGYTTELHSKGAFVLADIDRSKLWEHLTNFS